MRIIGEIDARMAGGDRILDAGLYEYPPVRSAVFLLRLLSDGSLDTHSVPPITHRFASGRGFKHS